METILFILLSLEIIQNRASSWRLEDLLKIRARSQNHFVADGQTNRRTEGHSLCQKHNVRSKSWCDDWRLKPGGQMMRFPSPSLSPFWNISRATPRLDANSGFSVKSKHKAEDMNVDGRNVGAQGNSIWTTRYISFYILSTTFLKSIGCSENKGGNLGFGWVARSGKGRPPIWWFDVKLLLTRNMLRCDWPHRLYPSPWLAADEMTTRGHGAVKHVKDTLRESIFAPRDCPENESSPCNPSFPTGSYLLERFLANWFKR